MSRYLLHIAGLLTALVAPSNAALAHAYPTHAEPAPGRTVAPPPTQVIMDFTEVLEPRFSRITVANAQQQRVDQGDVHAASDNPKRLIVGLKSLAPGKYKVTWHAVSLDTHSTDGTWVFTVGP